MTACNVGNDEKCGSITYVFGSYWKSAWSSFVHDDSNDSASAASAAKSSAWGGTAIYTSEAGTRSNIKQRGRELSLDAVVSPGQTLLLSLWFVVCERRDRALLRAIGFVLLDCLCVLYMFELRSRIDCLCIAHTRALGFGAVLTPRRYRLISSLPPKSQRTVCQWENNSIKGSRPSNTMKSV